MLALGQKYFSQNISLYFEYLQLYDAPDTERNVYRLPALFTSDARHRSSQRTNYVANRRLVGGRHVGSVIQHCCSSAQLGSATNSDCEQAVVVVMFSKKAATRSRWV
jgi:hypothetical protein